jgi:predicted CXXCH cytochrome family protein
MTPGFFLTVFNALLIVLLQLASGPSWAAPPDKPAGFRAVEQSKHNLGLSSDQACIICHTNDDDAAISPDAGTQEASPNPPLWNEKSTVKSYELAPLKHSFGPSAACLACHDDALADGTHGLNHPIAWAYPRRQDGQFVVHSTPQLRYWSVPDRTSSGVILPTGPHSEYLLPVGADPQDPDASGKLVRTTQGSVHCDSCHNPHNAGIAPFLRANPKTLCLICHDR